MLCLYYSSVPWLLRAEEILDVTFGKRLELGAVCADHLIDELLLLLLKLADFFLDTVLGYESIGEDRITLSDTVGAVDGLRLGGCILPRIKNEDGVRRRQIETDPASL